MSYQVIAPCVIARQQGELGNREFYQGGIIPWLSDAQAEHFLSENLVTEIDDGDPAAEDGAKPPKTAAKPVLVDWVVAHALKEDGSEYAEDEASELNKAQLWDIIDSIEV